MSQENVEIVRRAYSIVRERDTYSFITASKDRYDEYFHPEAEIVPPASYPDTDASYRGYAGFQRFQQQLDEIWDGWRFEAERFFDAGDRVLVFTRTSGTGKQSGAAFVMPTAHL